MSNVNLLESFKLKEQSIEELSILLASIREKYGSNVCMFWYSEKFSKDCYMCVYENI